MNNYKFIKKKNVIGYQIDGKQFSNLDEVKQYLKKKKLYNETKIDEFIRLLPTIDLSKKATNKKRKKKVVKEEITNSE